MDRFNSVHGDVSCEVCGNNQNECFEVRLAADMHVFDSFECAMLALSPRCGYCGCKILGHSIVFGSTVYCSYQCANDDSSRRYEAQILLRQQTNM